MGLLSNPNMPMLMAGTSLLSASGPSLTPNNPYAGMTRGLLDGYMFDQRKNYQAQQLALQQQQNTRAQQKHRAAMAAAAQKQKQQKAYAAMFGAPAQSAPQAPQAPMAWSPAGGAQAASGMQQPQGGQPTGQPAGGPPVSGIQKMFPNVTPGDIAAAQQMTPADGMKYLAERNKAPKPNIIKGADGYQYDANTGKRVLPNTVKPAEPAKTRELKTGESIKTQSFNSSTGQWETISEAPRFKPETSNSGREDFMVDNDRKILLQKLEGMTPEELLARTRKSTDTGFDNKNYDPQLEKQIRNALKKKRGDDPEFDKFQQLFAGAKGPNNPNQQPAIQAPQGAVELLKSDPSLAADFDAKYGKGAAKSILEGS